MAVDYIFHPSRPLIVTTGVGVVTDEELFAHWEKGYADCQLPWGTPELVDLRAVERLEVTSDGLRQLVALDAKYALQQRVPPKLAIVASSDLVYGMFRMCEALLHQDPNCVGVFRDLLGAEEWLGTPLPLP